MSRSLRACAALLALLAACSAEDLPLTQIVVVVDSDFSGLTRFEADIRGFEKPTKVKADLEDEPLPRRFSLVHDGGPLGPMSVTVRAYTDDGDEPILVEPRDKMFFEPGRTMLLKVDLLAACVALDCPEACIAPGKCVSAADAAQLVPWTGDPDELGVLGPLDAGMDAGPIMKPDASMEEAGMTMDSSMDAEPPLPDSDVPDDAEPDAEPDTGLPDAEVDAGEDAFVPEPTWPYVPSNVDTSDDGPLAQLARLDIALDCATTAIINSSDPPSFTGFCDAVPDFAVIEQGNDGGEVLAVVMSSLSIDAAATLKLLGSRPVVLLVEGDASIAGTIDASADGAQPGPGGNVSCDVSTGSTGTNAPTTSNGAYGASGGGGGGFGSAGTSGGTSGPTLAAVGGAVRGDATLVPLLGGCSGGNGGLGDGAAPMPSMYPFGGGGGGALQLSVAGDLQLTGVINASGGGGAAGRNPQGGGGGGGSGGAVLVEAEVMIIDALAVIAVNGGAGGGGQPNSGMLNSTPGQDGAASTANAAPGVGSGTGSNGGRGAALSGAATSGGVPTSTGAGCPTTVLCNWGGGGGGAGGVGRIRLNGASACVLPGVYSPAPVVGCAACGECPPQPDLTCSARAFGSSMYSLCSSALTQAAARALCLGVGQDLVKIDAMDENAFLASQINADMWIGASDVVEGNWRWLVDDSQFWSGDERGAAVGGAFAGWTRNDEPNGSGDCARLLPNGNWADVDCGNSLPFICEQP